MNDLYAKLEKLEAESNMFPSEHLDNLIHATRQEIQQYEDDQNRPEPEPEEEGDNCVRCGGPIDHNDPHVYCSNCA